MLDRLVMALTLTLALAARVEPSVYYVNKSGSDANSCATAQTDGATAKLTIASGVGCLSAGDTVQIRSGTYSETLEDIIPSGSAGNPVTVKGTTPNPPLLNGSGDWVIHIQNRTYVTVGPDLILDGTNVTTDVVKVTNTTTTHHIRIVGNEVRNSPGQGLMVSDLTVTPDAYEISGNTIHDNGSDNDLEHGLYSTSANGLIEHNHVYNHDGYGVHLYNSSDTVNDNVVRDNYVHDNGLGASGNSSGIAAVGGSNNQVYNNVVVNNMGENGAGIILAFATCDAAKIWNNTVYGNSGYGIHVASGCTNVAVTNNISYGNGSTNLSNDSGSTTLTTNLTTDPTFVDVDGGETGFAIQGSSAARDGGTTVGAVTDDYLGTARPQSGVYDIGAFEFVPAGGGAQCGSAAPIAYEDSGSGIDPWDGTSGTTIATDSMTVATGSTVVVGVRWYQDATAVTVSSCTDAGSNTYVDGGLGKQTMGSSVGQHQLFVAADATGFTGAVTCTFSGVISYRAIIAASFTNVVTLSPVDVTVTGTASGSTSVTSSSFSPSTATGVTVVSLGRQVSANANAINAGTNYTKRLQVSNGTNIPLAIEDRLNSPSGTQTASGSSADSSWWGLLGVNLVAESSSGACEANRLLLGVGR